MKNFVFFILTLFIIYFIVILIKNIVVKSRQKTQLKRLQKIYSNAKIERNKKNLEKISFDFKKNKKMNIDYINNMINCFSEKEEEEKKLVFSKLIDKSEISSTHEQILLSKEYKID
jgi:hypothetical protein